MHVTGLELSWGSEFSGLQIHGVRRRFYNDNMLMRYGQGYYDSRWIGNGGDQDSFYGLFIGDIYFMVLLLQWYNG